MSTSELDAYKSFAEDVSAALSWVFEFKNGDKVLRGMPRQRRQNVLDSILKDLRELERVVGKFDDGDGPEQPAA